MLKKRIQMFGAGLLVMAGLVFASAEAIKPVGAAQQPAYTCCVYTNNCPKGFTCVDKTSDIGCPVATPAYTKYCAPVGGTISTVGGDQ